MPEILDVTLREVGLLNGFSLSQSATERIITALDCAGIECIEVGYFRPSLWGAKTGGICCDPNYLGRLSEIKGNAKLAVFVHPDQAHIHEYRWLREAEVALVRIAVTQKSLEEVEAHVEAIRNLGIAVSLNIVRITELGTSALLKYSQLATRTQADILYLADSNGSLFPHELQRIIGIIREECRQPLGFHPHNHINLAFANALVAVDQDFVKIDCSLGGAGKGGGNLPTELFAAHQILSRRARYLVSPLAETFRQVVASALPTEGWEDSSLNHIFGLLNLNLDTVDLLRKTACARNVSVLELIGEQYSLH